MNKIVFILGLATALAACSGPRDEVLPQDLEKLESIKPAIEKLPAEERELLARYIARRTFAQALGSGEGGIPAGTTIGKAVDEQRKVEADQKLEEARQAALKAKLQAEREAAMKRMRDAVTVTLVSKSIETERGYSGIVMDENLEVTFGYRNNTAKPIAGVKGHISIRDLFGDELSGFLISNDDTIPPGETITWTGSRSVRFAMGDNQDRKLAGLSDDKFKVVWEPEMIVFEDGSRIEAPSQ